jgi:hypothetical protein
LSFKHPIMKFGKEDIMYWMKPKIFKSCQNT